MEKFLRYSFDDEYINKFCYDIDKKVIEMHFGGYYDLVGDVYISRACLWVIKDWSDAKIREGNNPIFSDLNKYIGIFSLILYVKYNGDGNLEMLVNTLDNRYVTMLFKNPKLSLEQIT